MVSGIEERVNPRAKTGTPSPRHGGPWQTTYRRLTIGLLLTMGGVAFESLAVATVMPATAADLGGLSLYGWAFSAFLLTNLVGIVVAGGESDRRGPAQPLMVGVSLFAIGLVVGGLAPSMAVLIAGRSLQGFGGGVIGSVAYVAVGRGYPETFRPRMLALLSTAWVVPGLVGPAVAGLIADSVGWRWVFLGLAPMIVASALLALPSLRRIPSGDATGRDTGRIRGAIRLAVGSALFLSGLGRHELSLALPLVIVGAAVALPALRRLLPAGTMAAARGLPAAVAVMGLLNMAFFGVDAFIPLGLVEIRGRSVAFAGLVLTGATITWTIGSWLQARFSDTASRRALVRSGLGLVALGSAGAAAVVVALLPASVGPAVWAIAGLGMGLAFSTISLVVLEMAPVGGEGRAASSLQLANVLGGGIGTGIGGAAIAALGATAASLRHAIVGQDVAMMIVACGAIFIAGRIPKESSHR
jgi:MFS family permease